MLKYPAALCQIQDKYKPQLLPSANNLVLVCWIQHCLQRWGGQWSLTVVMCPFHSTRQCHNNNNILPIVPHQLWESSAARAADTTADLNSSLVLHYIRWRGVFVLCRVLSPRLYSEAMAGSRRREWWEKAGRKRSSNGKRKEQGLPVCIDQSLYVHACPAL